MLFVEMETGKPPSATTPRNSSFGLWNRSMGKKERRRPLQGGASFDSAFRTAHMSFRRYIFTPRDARLARFYSHPPSVLSSLWTMGQAVFVYCLATFSFFLKFTHGKIDSQRQQEKKMPSLLLCDGTLYNNGKKVPRPNANRHDWTICMFRARAACM